MKKLILLFGLFVVLGIQPELFAPPLREDLDKLHISDNQEQAAENGHDSDSDSESDSEDAGDDECLIALCVTTVKEKLKDAKKKLTELADVYQNSSCVLSEGEIANVLDTLQACVTEYNKFAGTNYDLVELEVD